MKFVIRDDDTSFFTRPEDLECAYDFVENGCISLSVVPNTVFSHKHLVFPYGEEDREGFFDIRENTNLIEYLKKKKREGRYDILLHGFSHEYRKINDQWKSEMIWKSKEQLEEELANGKKILEESLDTNITVFVAPNNHIGKNAVSVIESLSMDFSGIIQKFDRKITPRYLVNFVKRWSYRLVKKIQLPGVLNYGKHKELCAYACDSFERLKYEYQECKRLGSPFVIYTHYWYLLKNPKAKELLKQIYQYAIDDGAELVPLSECFEERKK